LASRHHIPPPVSPEPREAVFDEATPLQCLFCTSIFRKRQTPLDRTSEWQNATGNPNEGSIAELVRITEVTVEDERQRGRQLDTKSASLADFSGLILTVETALTRSVFGLEVVDAWHPTEIRPASITPLEPLLGATREHVAARELSAALAVTFAQSCAAPDRVK
jgi:hypothetical protein